MTRGSTLVLLAALTGGGCVAFSARAQIGPVADSGGRGGVAGTITLGYGWAGERTAAGWTAGVESSQRDQLRVVSTLDAIRLHGEEWGVRAGVHSIAPWEPGPTSVGFHAALLYPLRRRTREPDEYDDPLLATKVFHLFAGIETHAGAYYAAPGADPDLEAGVALTLELLTKSGDAF